jgi:HlyD family secretion protein
MRKLIKRIIVILIPLGIIIGIGLLARRGCGNDSNMEYDYEKITVGDVIKSISATGKLDLFETVPVSAGVNGAVKQLFADYNQPVKSGDLLAVMDSLEADQNLANYTETYKRAQLELESVKEVYESKKMLLEDKLVSPREVEESRRAYEKNLTIYNQAKMTYDNCVGAVNAKKVYAPVTGIILQRGVELKQLVNAGTMLFTIAPDMKKMKLIINIDESDIGYVRMGLPVMFSVSAYPDKVFSGKITQVRMNPVLLTVGQAGSRIVTYESLVECDNNNMLLRPGMSVSAMVNIDNRKSVLRAPNASFMISPVPVQSVIGKKFVWKHTRMSIKSLPMERLEVTTGLMGDDFTELKSGDLKDGDEILIGMHKKIDLKVPNAK